MSDKPDDQRHYQYVAKAIEYIQRHASQQPSLEQIAGAVGLSEYHLQRIFSQWAGVSPKRFLQFLTKERALRALKASDDILQAALESGLSGPGRLHDLMVTCEAMSPGEIKAQGRGLTIDYGFAPSPFGQMLLGWTARGICYLSFADYQQDSQPYDQTQRLQQQWPRAQWRHNNDGAWQLSNKIFNAQKGEKLHLLIKGTNFQLKVWQALISTAPGQLVSYTQLAEMSGSARAQRAVGSAMANNTIGWLIPCHRVIRGTGEFGHYRWGIDRKLAMQGWEASYQQGGRELFTSK